MTKSQQMSKPSGSRPSPPQQIPKPPQMQLLQSQSTSASTPTPTSSQSNQKVMPKIIDNHSVESDETTLLSSSTATVDGLSDTLPANLSKPDQSAVDIQNPTLSIDDINISLKVVGDLKEGYKLKIVNGKHLAVEDSRVSFITRYSAGQGRDKIIDFLENLLSELTRNVDLILSEIRNKVNVDNNICIIDGLIRNASVFMHNYERMRSVYQGDSSAYNRLGINKQKFYGFFSTFFRDVTTHCNK